MYIDQYLTSTDNPIHESIISEIDGFGKSNNAAVRVLYGAFSEFITPPWTQEQADGNGVSLANAQSNGITIVCWGSASPQIGVGIDNMPGSAYTDSNKRAMSINEIMAIAPGTTHNAIAHTIKNDDGSNLQIGEYGERTYWFFLHLAWFPDADKLNLDLILFDPLRKSMDKNFVEKFRSEQALVSAKAFASMMTDSPKQRVRELEGRINSDGANLAQYEQSIIDLKVNLNRQQREMDMLLKSYSAPEDHWVQEWQAIERHEMIVPGTLAMNADKQISFDTKLLHIEDPAEGEGVRYPLGNMRITISMSENSVKIKNINNRRRECDHPHVRNEVPCWGEWASEVTDHIVNMRVSALVEFIFQYLSTYNPQDEYGRAIRYFKENNENLEAAVEAINI